MSKRQRAASTEAGQREREAGFDHLIQQHELVTNSLPYKRLKNRVCQLERQAQSGQVALRIGDLLHCDSQYIVHQISCSHRGAAAGIAADLFSSYPYADSYRQRVEVDEPGSIQVFPPDQFGRGVINLCGQLYVGKPRPRRESSQQREIWFRQGLDAIAELQSVKEVAFPYGIGCGLAGGCWMRYLSLIVKWAAAHPRIAVSIYMLP